MKTKWKRRFITFILLTVAVIALVEFQNWMKSKAAPCNIDGCPRPRGHGLHIDPFPDELVPAGTATNEPGTVEADRKRSVDNFSTQYSD